jgi:hypothetical protein
MSKMICGRGGGRVVGSGRGSGEALLLPRPPPPPAGWPAGRLRPCCSMNAAALCAPGCSEGRCWGSLQARRKQGQWIITHSAVEQLGRRLRVLLGDDGRRLGRRAAGYVPVARAAWLVQRRRALRRDAAALVRQHFAGCVLLQLCY